MEKEKNSICFLNFMHARNVKSITGTDVLLIISLKYITGW
jgi:hypothetical protein